MRRWFVTGSSERTRFGHAVVGPSTLGLSVLALAFGVSTASAATPARPTPALHTLEVTVSPAKAGAHPVLWSVELGYEMQCGYPGPGPVVLSFPAAVRLPARIARSAVLVDGKAAASVQAAGRSLAVGLAPPPQIMCDVIGPGRLTIELTGAAGLGNPARAGSYRLTATRGTTSFSARFAIGS